MSKNKANAKMSRGPGGHGKGPRGAKNAGKTLKRLLSYIIKGYGLRLLVVLLCLGASAFSSVFSARFLQSLIVEIGVMVEAAKAGLTPDGLPLALEIVKIVIIYLIGIVSGFLSSFLMVKVGQGVLKKIREDMFSNMQSLPIKYFDRNEFGDIMSHYTNDTDAIEQLIAQSIPNLVSGVVTIIASFVMMLVTSWQLTIVVILTLFIMLYVVKVVGGGSAKYFIAQQKSVGKLNGYIEEMANGQKVVKVFNHEQKAKADFDQLNDELCGNMTKAHTYANIFMPIMANLNYLQYVLVAVAGGLLALNGLLFVPGGENTPYAMLGVVSAFLLLSRNFSRPISMVSQQINSIVMALAGAERVFELMDEKPETDDGYVTLVNAKFDKNGELVPCDERTGIWAWRHPHGDGTLTYTQLKGEITLTEVDFEYEEGKPVLHDITVYANPGQRVALVGATGAGKTTITNLINRFYDIADGKVRYDGININKIKKSDLRRSLGIVLQDTNLFTGTIAENIRYGRLDATDEEVEAAAKLANAHDFITRLPDGYQTMLTSDGANLSQGQRQLLSIARAAIADAPVMIMDEATSSIDTRTELLVQRGTNQLMQGRTVFIIAHRLSTVKNCDVIMVMEKGRIIERGTHESLIEKGGKYYQLYTGAFELE
ncbi:MAG: ABC transporter ATP-binding protein [Clostridia bacterium]|nr:ABC transporter ATP-binding protein [Clostridia bacterium]